MTFMKFILILAACVFTFTSCEQTADDLGINLSLDTRTLSNGLKVIMVQDPTVPIVSYQSWFRVGSVDEKPGITGISHLFEHLMFKGTPKYGPKEFFQQLEAKARKSTRSPRATIPFTTNLLCRISSNKVIDMESDRMANLTLTDDVLTPSAWSFLRNEDFARIILRRKNSRGIVAGSVPCSPLSMARHRISARSAGDDDRQASGLLQISLSAGKRCDYYRRRFDKEKTFATIKKYYGGIKAEPRPSRKDIPVEPEQTEERRLLLRDEVASERFSQAYHVTAADNDDSYSLDVLANILFEGDDFARL